MLCSNFQAIGVLLLTNKQVKCIGALQQLLFCMSLISLWSDSGADGGTFSAGTLSRRRALSRSSRRRQPNAISSVCVARVGKLVLGEDFHGFDVEVEAMLRLGWESGFADARECVACLGCCEIGAPLNAAARNDSNFELRRALRQFESCAVDDVVCDDAEPGRLEGADGPLREVE